VWRADGNRGFVKQRIRVELLPYTGGNFSAANFEELEASVWWTIAGQMRHYVPIKDSEGDVIPKAERGFLRRVVHGVVIDYFRAQYNETRDVRRETLVEFDYNRGIANPNFVMVAKSVSPQGEGPGSAD
jgi:hypothetical protein